MLHFGVVVFLYLSSYLECLKLAFGIEMLLFPNVFSEVFKYCMHGNC